MSEKIDKEWLDELEERLRAQDYYSVSLGNVTPVDMDVYEVIAVARAALEVDGTLAWVDRELDLGEDQWPLVTSDTQFKLIDLHNTLQGNKEGAKGG